VYPGADVRALRELESVLAGFDVVHTHAGRAGLLGRVAARRVGVPVVVHTLHGFPFNEFQSWWTRRALLGVERWLGGMTDFFLTDGTFVASEAVRLRIAAPDRVRSLISSIDPVVPVSVEARRSARAVLGVPEGVPVIGTAARLARQKGPLDLVRAFAGLGRSDAWLVWLGDGDLRGRVESLVAELGLSGRVVLAGDRSDVGSLLPAFDVFALASWWEGLPCSLVEAMCCGVPVVATAVNSVPELVVAGRTGLLARPGDPASLTVALRRMLEEPELAAGMAEEARRLIGQLYEPDRIGPELMDVYDTALRRAHTRTA
jgi:glycosyltransferase involved in cell wall biosynthesis